MSNWVSYLNGEYSDRPPGISVYDSGFVQGVAVAEQLRTFSGKLFRLDEHLARLKRSMEIVGMETDGHLTHLREVAQHIVQNNHPQLADGDDLGVTIFVTPGPYPGMWNDLPARPTVCVHSQPLLFASWAEKYMSGQRLIISGTRQVSPLNWPMELKCRSRIHYYLADREAKKQDPESRALLLDLDGFVCEASSANIFLYSTSEGLLAPLASKTLPGVSLATIHDLAAQLRIRFQERNVLPEELFSADEVMLCSTSPCVLPVTRIDGRWVGSGVPGPMFQRLLSAWSELVHLDIASQARQFAQRTGPGMTSEQEA